jgi:transcriptional regulator with XRE-family HTH domain
VTPYAFRQARRSLGLSLDQMAEMLGYLGDNRDKQVHQLETGERPIREPVRRLLEAYLSGYRPCDWPDARDNKPVRRNPACGGARLNR